MAHFFVLYLGIRNPDPYLFWGYWIDFFLNIYFKGYIFVHFDHPPPSFDIHFSPDGGWGKCGILLMLGKAFSLLRMNSFLQECTN